MRKKLTSLALALVMCLGLTAPAFAAKVGDTTVEDNAGYLYTLSQPVEGISETTVGDAQGEFTVPVYTVPVGTVIRSVCPEGEMFEDAGGIFYSLTDEEGLKQAGDAVQNSGSSHAEVFSVEYKILAKNGEGVEVVDDLDREVDYFGNPVQPLPEGQYLIARNICWAYRSVGGGASGSSTEIVGKSSYLCVEIEAKSETPAAAPAYQVSDWAKDRVAQAVEAGLAPSGLGTDYRVNITRAQFAAAAVKLYEAMSGETIPAASSNPFTDTADPEVLKAAAMGFVGGVGGGRFAPDDLLTREQAAVMFAAVYTKLGGEVPAVTATAFADDASVASWARNAVAFMSKQSIISGTGNNNFSPQGQASIEQALLIALNMLEKLK